MAKGTRWTRHQLLVAFNLYCQLPFGQLHAKNLEIVKYAKLLGRTPSALAMKLCNIASLDPAITNSGRKGLANASSKEKSMWQEMNDDWNNFSIEVHQAIQQVDFNQEDQNSHPNETKGGFSTLTTKDIGTKVTENITSVKTRIGQDFFRKTVLSSYNYRCCISGLSKPQLLIASHIIPWKDDVNNRLNPHNGLSLSAIHDKAFDYGFITIKDDMTILVSEECLKDENNDKFLSKTLIKYHGKSITLPHKFQPDLEFLKFHRDEIFKG